MPPVATSQQSVSSNGSHAHKSARMGNGVDSVHSSHSESRWSTSMAPIIVFDSTKGAKIQKGKSTSICCPPTRELFLLPALPLASSRVRTTGHFHPRIAETLVEQAQKLTLSSRAFYNSVFPKFARQITEMFSYESVLLMNTGAEAVETAVKLARKWSYMKKGVPEGKAVVMSFEGNFHGRTLGVISMSTDPDSRGGFGPYLDGVGSTVHDNGETQTIRYGVIEDLERALDLNGKHVAAFLVKPIQGEAGIVVPPSGYLARVRELCTKHNVLLSCDEIQTGLCRTGKMLCCEHDQIRPDIVLLGKALSGGVYPVSAVLVDRDIMYCIRPGEHGSTYDGNPLGCAVAMTVIHVLVDEKLSERAETLGRDLPQRNCGIEVTARATSPRQGSTECNRHRRSEQCQGKDCVAVLPALEEPRRACEADIVRFAPPLVISEEDLRKAVNVIAECLNDLDRLDDIPGEVESEKGHKDVLTN
ncbi:hypothetical protein SCLCIDRAFT_28573 [Scleroderma citrinum Foug A]|uniref:Ornithine aminotransferase n=1 Tax=Scleroderma citrinum Foug A TaxID=1036808 RepID=A0A0C2ZZI2_9AGAM|nr:hypothetical protein SCLCIDRAFT_28573 [Scleroderma citrinum Foug A]